MRDFLKVGLIAFVAAFAGAFLAITVVGGNDQSPAAVGGYTEGYWDSADGYKVDGTTVINGSGVITGTSQTLSTTLSVTGTTTLGRVNTDELTQGGGQCTITDANGGTYTLTADELKDCNYLYMTASGAGQEVIALTLPATSTMTLLLPDVGDYREWLIDASDLAAATTTTITLGTGIDMIAVLAAEDVIDGAEYSELRCWRKSDTDVACVTSELVNSD